MKAAKDRVTYEGGWTRFVDSVGEFWTRFRKEGQQQDAGFVGWVGSYQNQRDNDDLLDYITKARNQSQHGLVSLGWTSSSGLIVGQRFKGGISSLKVYADGTFEAEAAPQHDSATVYPVAFDFGKPTFPVIRDMRYKPPTETQPPQLHRGANINGLPPVDAAVLAWMFYSECLSAALKRAGIDSKVIG